MLYLRKIIKYSLHYIFTNKCIRKYVYMDFKFIFNDIVVTRTLHLYFLERKGRQFEKVGNEEEKRNMEVIDRI